MIARNIVYKTSPHKVVMQCLIYAVLITGQPSSSMAQTWVHDKFEDFNKGILDASGANIYISKDGKIRTIHRFDYNDDGYIDLLFPNTHDTIDNLPSTLAEVMPDRIVKESDVAWQGSLQVASGDLNLDGYIDLVFFPNHDGIQNPRNFLQIIYGGEDGWPASRATGPLPVNFGGKAAREKTIALADLNQDGWPDIVTLNSPAWKVGQPTGSIIRIYSGGRRGYLNTRFHDIGIPEAVCIASGDFDGNGHQDVAVLRNDNKITFLWGAHLKEKLDEMQITEVALPANNLWLTMASGDINNNGKTDLLIGTNRDLFYTLPSLGNGAWGKLEEIIGFKATNISIGDLDSDGHNDIVLSYFDQRIGPSGEYGGATDEQSGRAANILWGSRDGFSVQNSTSLEAMYIGAAAIGDFDGDGHKDIAVAINRGTADFACHSIIYYGNSTRQFTIGIDGVKTSGAIYVHAFEDKNMGKDRIVFCNSRGGAVGEQVPTQIFFGGPEGFSEMNMTEVPMRSGYAATVADLNADGFTDIVLLNQMHHGQKDDPWAGANIFMGSAEGYDFSRRIVLNEYYLGSSNVADLNRDGYLDLVLGAYEPEGFDSSIIIYYGGPVGYSRENREVIPSGGRSLGIQLADYDKDGWLDIAVNSFTEVGIRIFYGSERGFDHEKQVQLDAPAVGDNKTADLNGDGWLDLIVCSYSDFAANIRIFDMGTYIFWGGPEGFNHANAQWLPGFAALGPVVADFDNDGHLDLFLPHYHGTYARDQIPSYLYWGSDEGFHIYNRTELINSSAAQGFAADFDRDGKLDIAVANHTHRGNHNAYSRVFYNDGERFKNARVEELPTRGPHWSQNMDMGNIYNRSWIQTFKSSPIDWMQKRDAGVISYSADSPQGTKIEFQVRSAATQDELLDLEWTDISASGKFKVRDTDRIMQYKALFVSDNGDRYSVLDKVTVNLE